MASIEIVTTVEVDLADFDDDFIRQEAQDRDLLPKLDIVVELRQMGAPEELVRWVEEYQATPVVTAEKLEQWRSWAA